MYSDNIHLIHRRTEFRGNPETIKNSKNLKVHLPFIPLSIKRNDSIAQSVTIKNVETEETLEISVDYIFVNFGNVASQSKFDFPTLGAFLLVDENNKVAENIYAIGDVCQYKNKTRRLAPGISEANKVFGLIKN